jgi:hypothetical protein
LGGPLYRFVETNLTAANYYDLMVDVMEMGLPSSMKGGDRRPERLEKVFGPIPPLEEVQAWQKAFRDDLRHWSSQHSGAVPWKMTMRIGFQQFIYLLLTFAKRLPAGRPPSQCSICRLWFTPRRESQTTCGERCRTRQRRTTRAPKAPARVTSTARYEKRAESLK